MACGLWHPDRDTLHAIRTAIAAKPGRWRAVVEEPPFVDRFRLGGESLKRPPAGFDKDHALIEDLKRKDFIAYVDLTEADVTAPATSSTTSSRCAATAGAVHALPLRQRPRAVLARTRRGARRADRPGPRPREAPRRLRGDQAYEQRCGGAQQRAGEHVTGIVHADEHPADRQGGSREKDRQGPRTEAQQQDAGDRERRRRVIAGEARVRRVGEERWIRGWSTNGRGRSTTRAITAATATAAAEATTDSALAATHCRRRSTSPTIASRTTPAMNSGSERAA